MGTGVTGVSPTWTLLLVAGLHLLAAALAGVALHACALAHAEPALPAGVTRLGAEAPVVPGTPFTVSCRDGDTVGHLDQYGEWHPG